jgi:chemotaxis protein methyltransferase CheR
MSGDPEAEIIEIGLVLQAIRLRYGYDLSEYVPDSMHRRVRAALVQSGLAHLGELSHRLLHDPRCFASVLDQLTVQVSEMFRDPDFYLVFRERVVPVLRTYPELRFWHAGCSSGEEVYASAILLTEEGLYDRSQIYATDLSATAVELAREGVYDGDHVALFARNYERAGGRASFSDYVTSRYGRIAVRQGLKQNVVFFQHNLAQDYAIGQMNVVFCRNVLFYFERPLRTRVLDLFAECLCHGGFLCLGAAEASPDSLHGAFGAFDSASRIYKRGGGG